MQNLGKLLADAGLRGASAVSPPQQTLLKEILGLARKSGGKSVTDEDRLKRLPPEFEILRSITWGDEFMREFARLCQSHPHLINRDLVAIVCELAHKTRDGLIEAGKGGRQKSFGRSAILQLLSLKHAMPSDPRAIVGFVLNRLLK